MSEVDFKPVTSSPTGDFEPEQKRYLEGFVAGLQIAKAAKGLSGTNAAPSAAAAPEPTGPDAAAFKAQDRVLASGGKLSDQEKFKREQHPFDTYERLKEHAAKSEYPKPPDNSAGDSLVCSTSRPTRTPTCAGCASRTGSSRRNSSPASPTSPSATAAAMRM
jgi:hypothetical protein